jgi:hypothetical protein
MISSFIFSTSDLIAVLKNEFTALDLVDMEFPDDCLLQLGLAIGILEKIVGC